MCLPICLPGYQPSPASPKAYWENTFVTASRAMKDYLLDMEDLEDLRKRSVRSAHSSNRPIVCYLKSEVEKRCVSLGSYCCSLHMCCQTRLLATTVCKELAASTMPWYHDCILRTLLKMKQSLFGTGFKFSG